MAVETFYRSTRDKDSEVMDRKSADAHDQMLELAEKIAESLGRNFPDMNEKHCEDLGIFMAKNRGAFTAAFKGNLAALSEINAAAPAE
ncbi:YebG family protein (plasmid) [Pseudomonas fulva]|uniref:YebG family protein n=2 Tax=Pseudomonas putida group TaxID=136845 RepID=A0ABD7BQ25_PSEPU|nr:MULTISPECIES: YebG family protein [Pseudomonas putida group]QOD01753.1 YebG family protein [Pseudomonas putida]QPH47032.1 YebG family protein [Pseudomonas fulva]QPH52207.1 YebG family protein [Pseudomonas fulva]